MKELLEKQLENFLAEYFDPQKPLLLALSGGPDSTCLLHLLAHYKRRNPLNLHVAHVDHAWRIESQAEAIWLQTEVERLGFPFHLKRLDPALFDKGNHEAIAREERLDYFLQLCQEQGFQAVLTAHHADDQAETVFKRILEGATFSHLSGLQRVSQIEGVPLWRPLLAVTKKEISSWLHRHALESFDDKSNKDLRYLRARFRETILPFLSKEFGKEITGNLCRLGEEAKELRSYIDTRMEFYKEHLFRGSFGLCLDLSTIPSPHIWEVKQILKKICKQEQILLTHRLVTTLAEFLLSGKGDRYFEVNHRMVYIDRHRFFILCDEEKQRKANRNLVENSSYM